RSKEVVVERLSMRKVREVLRLKFDAGLSVRKIAASLRISNGSEPPRVSRRLQPLRGWSDEKTTEVFPRGP
ncbi:IS21 family transposase, partial [Pseudomonas savastanoi]|nr:IS21 family transposase [Pseudomonas savastanoi]